MAELAVPLQVDATSIPAVHTLSGILVDPLLISCHPAGFCGSSSEACAWTVRMPAMLPTEMVAYLDQASDCVERRWFANILKVAIGTSILI